MAEYIFFNSTAVFLIAIAVGCL